MRPGCIVASVLSADLGAARDVCVELEEAGIDAVQWDVMDGHFVPNLTVGPDVIAACREATSVPFEAHLMVEDADSSLARYIEAGCEFVIVHAEASPHLHRTLSTIKELGAKAGVALNPATPVESVQHVLDLLDLVLIMTVEPGFGGQPYIGSMDPKIHRTRHLLEDVGEAPWLEVDGGISSETIHRAAAAGADRFVVGSALFRHPEGPGAVVPLLHAALSIDSELIRR